MITKIEIIENNNIYTLNNLDKSTINIGSSDIYLSLASENFLLSLSYLIESIKGEKEYIPLISDQFFKIYFKDYTYSIRFSNYKLVEEVLTKDEIILLKLSKDKLPKITSYFFKINNINISNEFEYIELDNNILNLPRYCSYLQKEFKYIEVLKDSTNYNGWKNLNKSELKLFHNLIKNWFFDQRIDTIVGNSIFENGYEFRIEETGSGMRYLWNFIPKFLKTSKHNGTLIDICSSRPLHEVLKNNLYNTYLKNSQVISIHDYNAPKSLTLDIEKA